MTTIQGHEKSRSSLVKTRPVGAAFYCLNSDAHVLRRERGKVTARRFDYADVFPERCPYSGSRRPEEKCAVCADCRCDMGDACIVPDVSSAAGKYCSEQGEREVVGEGSAGKCNALCFVGFACDHERGPVLYRFQKTVPVFDGPVFAGTPTAGMEGDKSRLDGIAMDAGGESRNSAIRSSPAASCAAACCSSLIFA
jgi:hypothetical protein